jgi:hypothetical protein
MSKPILSPKKVCKRPEIAKCGAGTRSYLPSFIPASAANPRKKRNKIQQYKVVQSSHFFEMTKFSSKVGENKNKIKRKR